MERALNALLATRPTMTGLSLGQGQRLTPGRLRIELLAGLTVALALVPEAVAFAFVAGVHPLVGLYAAFIVGLITALIGGRPGMISGATGALAVVMVALVAQHGVEYLFATVVLMGLLQVFAGVLQWGKFIRLVPHPVMLGFVNGLAIVIFLAQLGQFKVPGTMENTGHGMGGGEWLIGRAALYDAGAGGADHGGHLGHAEADQRDPGAAGRDRDRGRAGDRLRRSTCRGWAIWPRSRAGCPAFTFRWCR